MKKLSPADLHHERELFAAWAERQSIDLAQNVGVFRDRCARMAWASWRDRAAIGFIPETGRDDLPGILRKQAE